MLLEILILGALMGMLGQGARAVAGLKSMSDDAKALGLSPNDLFAAGRLIKSFLIGSLIGLASALVYIMDGGSTSAEPSWQLLLAWAAAAYTGTDFLESFISQYLSPGASAVQQKAAAVKNTVTDVALNLPFANLALPQLIAPLDGILSGWVNRGVKPLDDDTIRAGIAFCLNAYEKPTQPVPAGSKYWQGQLSAQFKGSDTDWIQAACNSVHDNPANVHDNPAPFAANGLTVNSDYILRKYNASTPASFKIEDFFACIKQCYQHPLGLVEVKG